MVKIYTRTGDSGKTSLFGGKRVSKSSLRIEAIGTVDELNSAIGVAVAQYQRSKINPSTSLRARDQKHRVKIKNELEQVQNDLFNIGAILASPSSLPFTLNALRLSQRVEQFEKLIDQLAEKLPELRNFILPGGGKIGASLHLARSICRRAERRIVELNKRENVPNDILIYFNRLSDLLFTMARIVNYKEKQKEVVWNKTKIGKNSNTT